MIAHLYHLPPPLPSASQYSYISIHSLSLQLHTYTSMSYLDSQFLSATCFGDGTISGLIFSSLHLPFPIWSPNICQLELYFHVINADSSCDGKTFHDFFTDELQRLNQSTVFMLLKSHNVIICRVQ